MRVGKNIDRPVQFNAPDDPWFKPATQISSLYKITDEVTYHDFVVIA
jgi:hypothetical protein